MQTLHEQESMHLPVRTANQAHPKEQAQAEEHTALTPLHSKRLVSKREYASNVGKKAMLSSSGATLYGLGLLGIAIVLTITCLLDAYTLRDAVFLTVISGMVLASLGCFYVGRRTLKKAVKLDAGVPLTRANTAELPAPDSLVRASQEPMQAQETVLLRAAVEGAHNAQEEQLVRASVQR